MSQPYDPAAEYQPPAEPNPAVFDEPSPWSGSAPQISEVRDEPLYSPAYDRTPAYDWQQPQGTSREPVGWLAPPLPEPHHRRPRLAIVLTTLSVLLALVIAGGGVATYRALRGGGTQPEQVLPGDVIAFAKVDLDPSAGQKIAAIRFARKLPKVGASFGTGKDLRQSIFELLTRDGQLPTGLSYQKDIEPWLGDRIAVGVRRGASDDQLDALVAIQASDEAKARDGLARLTTALGQGQFGVAFRKGYAIVGKTQQVVDRAIAAPGSLADSANYRADVALVGTQGVVSGWADSQALDKAAPHIPFLTGGMAGAVGGGTRAAFTVRFTSGNVELVMKSRVGDAGSSPGAGGMTALSRLPSSTAGALEIGSPGLLIDQLWAGYKTGFQQSVTIEPPGGQPTVPGAPGDPESAIREAFGLNLPQDLKTLVGSDLLFSIDSAGLGSDETPRIGVRSTTDPSGADRILARVRSALTSRDQDLPFTWARTADGVIAATDPAYLTQLSGNPAHTLAEQRDFHDAVGDLSHATSAGYLSTAAIADAMQRAGDNADEIAAWRSFRAFGLVTTVEGGIATTRLRLLTK